jgi:sodium-coupled neutral amino acid transporter 9
MVNTMIGTTIVALPYLFARSGIATGLVILGGIGAVSCFTCLLVVTHGKMFDEFSQFVEYWMGGTWRIVSWLMSNLVILGACIIYHILMQESLFQVVQSLLQAAGVSASGWSRPIAAIVPLIVLPLANLKKMDLLVKLSSGGFVFVTYTIVFIAYHGIHAMASKEVSFVPYLGMEDSGAQTDGHMTVVWGFRNGFGALGGAAMLSFFIHNIIQPITKNADPATKHKDIVSAFATAAACYMVIGTLGYIGFGDRATGSGLEGNFLEIFGTDLANKQNLYAFTARFSLFLQLMTVFPVLMFIIRTQTFGFLLSNQYPGYFKVAALNIGIIAITYVFAALNVNVAVVTRFSGAICGIVLIFVVPTVIDRLAAQREKRLTLCRTLVHGAIICLGTVFLAVQFVPSLT